MKLIRIKAIAKKETLQVLRDPFSLAMAFIVPIFLLIIFGYAITFDIREIDTVILDRDGSMWSRELASELKETGYFTIVRYVDREEEIEKELDSGAAKVAVMIPPDFSRNIHSGKSAELGVMIDGSDANTATIAHGYVTGIVTRFSARLAPASFNLPIDVRTRIWYNPDLKSRNFIIPGLIAVIMAVIAAMLTSLTVSREWDRGTMEQLIATPVTRYELIIGKVIPYFCIGFADTLLCIAMGTQLFHVPLRGSLLLLLALSSIFLAGALCMGILISIIARQQLLSSQMALLSTFLPSFLLSGFMFAIVSMPRPIQFATYAVSARYFINIIKGIFLKGVTFRVVLAETILLIVYGAIMLGFAGHKFRKRVE